MPCDESGYFSDEDIFIEIVNFTLTISIIVVNSFILSVVAFNWKLIRLEANNRASVLLTINLCIADFFIGIFDVYFSLPMYLCNLATYLGQLKLACLLRFSLIIGADMASAYSLVIIAVERYIYVVHALRYSELMNIRRTFLMISLVWTAAILGTSPLFVWNHWKDDSGSCRNTEIVPKEHTMAFSIGKSFLVIIIIATLHWRIHREALKIFSVREPAAAVSALKTKSARVVLIICVVYVISCVPFAITYLCMKNGVHVMPLFHKLSNSIVDLNYAVNPFVYAYNNRAIRSAILRTLRACRPTCKFKVKRVTISGDHL